MRTLVISPGFAALETVAVGVKEDNHQINISNTVTWARGQAI